MPDYVKQIEEKGYCLVPQAYTGDQVERALALTRSWYERTVDSVSTNVPYLNRNHPVVYNLQSKDWHFVDLLFSCHVVHDVLKHFLNDPWFKAIPPEKPNYILRA